MVDFFFPVVCVCVCIDNMGFAIRHVSILRIINIRNICQRMKLPEDD